MTLIGCGKAQTQVVDSALQSYVDAFSKAGKVVVTVDVVFGDVPPNMVAKCHIEDSTRVVVVGPQFQELSEPKRELVIFHELGHCVLNRTHTSATTFYGDTPGPASIMFPSLFSDSQEQVYVNNRQSFINELFGK